MKVLNITPIGYVKSDVDGYAIQLHQDFADALIGLEGFSHINVIWWFSEHDDAKSRTLTTIDTPYHNTPNTIGVFATQSPERPTLSVSRPSRRQP